MWLPTPRAVPAQQPAQLLVRPAPALRVVAGELDLLVALLGQLGEDRLEALRGHPVADREELDPDPALRQQAVSAAVTVTVRRCHRRPRPQRAAAVVPAAAPTKPRRLSLGVSPMFPSLSDRAHTPAARREENGTTNGARRPRSRAARPPRRAATVPWSPSRWRRSATAPLLGLAVADHEHVRAPCAARPRGSCGRPTRCGRRPRRAARPPSAPPAPRARSRRGGRRAAARSPGRAPARAGTRRRSARSGCR